MDRVVRVPPRAVVSGGLMLVNPFSGTVTCGLEAVAAVAAANAANSRLRLREVGSAGPFWRILMVRCRRGWEAWLRSQKLAVVCARRTAVLPS
ncbi:hypothetical protein OIM90_27255 [Streptomyces sp. AD16]|nr:hypothetical protein OIM90_27255 [Streptomyces sp. AD16]